MGAQGAAARGPCAHGRRLHQAVRRCAASCCFLRMGGAYEAPPCRLATACMSYLHKLGHDVCYFLRVLRACPFSVNLYKLSQAVRECGGQQCVIMRPDCGCGVRSLGRHEACSTREAYQGLRQAWTLPFVWLCCNEPFLLPHLMYC